MIKVLPTKVHRINDLDFTEYTYDVIYASQDSEIILNGSTIFLLAGEKLIIKIYSIEEISGQVFLLGNDNNEVNTAENLLAESPNNTDLVDGLVIIDDNNIIIVDNYNTALLF